MTTKNTTTNKTFNRTLYTPHYRYISGLGEGVEIQIKQDIRDLIEEHDSSIWTPVENTIIEVFDGKAYGRTVIFRDLTSED